jgi:hypothetical protein
MNHDMRRSRTASRPDSHVGWRAARLRRAGFERRAALELARDDAFDLHTLLDLVDRGCPPHLAARILAPLEHERVAQ